MKTQHRSRSAFHVLTPATITLLEPRLTVSNEQCTMINYSPKTAVLLIFNYTNKWLVDWGKMQLDAPRKHYYIQTIYLFFCCRLLLSDSWLANLEVYFMVYDDWAGNSVFLVFQHYTFTYIWKTYLIIFKDTWDIVSALFWHVCLFDCKVTFKIWSNLFARNPWGSFIHWKHIIKLCASLQKLHLAGSLVNS